MERPHEICLRQRYGETLDVVIPPPKDAVIRLQSARDATVRDRHDCPNPQQRPHGLADGNRVQPAQPNRNADGPLFRSVIGPKLKSRSFSRQITEIATRPKSFLNTMTALGRPVFERIA